MAGLAFPEPDKEGRKVVSAQLGMFYVQIGNCEGTEQLRRKEA